MEEGDGEREIGHCLIFLHIFTVLTAVEKKGLLVQASGDRAHIYTYSFPSLTLTYFLKTCPNFKQKS